MSNDQPLQDYDKPVAYDFDGKPLYAHPPSSSKPQIVHLSRATDPEKPIISDASKIKHDKSKKIYPFLNLSDGEYIISTVRRHPIGLIVPIAISTILISIAFAMLFNFDIFVDFFKTTSDVVHPSLFIFLIIIFIVTILLGTFSFYYVYTNNKFFLTNESVIQYIQKSLFSKQEQTISLGSIEDAGYEQNGIIQQLFGFGSIRLSTIGDETTYRFSYVADPKGQVALLNNAVEAFKNGRPVES